MMDLPGAIYRRFRKRETWLDARKILIGGSDAPDILGLGYRSPFQLYCQKLDLVPAAEDTRELRWGRLVEEPIAQEYSEQSGRRLFNPGLHLYLSRGISFASCTLDRIIFDEQEKSHGDLQIKKRSRLTERELRDDIYTLIQVQHELMVTGLRWGSVAAELARYVTYFDFERDEEFISLLLEKEEKFVRRLKDKNPPPVDSSQATKETLKRLYPRDSGETIVLPAEFEEKFLELEKAKANQKEAEEIRAGIENEIKSAMGEATFATIPNINLVFSWRWQKAHYKAQEERDVESRVFRIIDKGDTHGNRKGSTDLQVE